MVKTLKGGISATMFATILMIVGVSSVITSTILIYGCCVVESRDDGQWDEDGFAIEDATVQEYSREQDSDVACSASKHLSRFAST